MLQLTVEASTAQQVVLAVHGRISGAAIRIFGRECQRHLDGVARLVLILDGVPFIDDAGLDLLRSWSGQGLVLRGGSPFLRALLAAEGMRPLD